MKKMKILDVKIIQHSYKKIGGSEILQGTKVFDGTGKVQIDESAIPIELLGPINAQR